MTPREKLEALVGKENAGKWIHLVEDMIDAEQLEFDLEIAK